MFYRGNYVKDLERLGRDLRRVAILDNSPASYIFHPDNAVSSGGQRGLTRLHSLSSSGSTWDGGNCEPCWDGLLSPVAVGFGQRRSFFLMPLRIKVIFSLYESIVVTPVRRLIMTGPSFPLEARWCNDLAAGTCQSGNRNRAYAQIRVCRNSDPHSSDAFLATCRSHPWLTAFCDVLFQIPISSS